MAEANNTESFEEIVEWAYRTLPQKIRDLPDFPGIQVTDEPPKDILRRRKLSPGSEMLGCYSGIRRTARQHNQVRIAPDLIFIFRGPIERCSKGDLQAEVKEVVWHEVAHWLGHNEAEVKELGLATLTLPLERTAHSSPDNKRTEPAKTMAQQSLVNTSETAEPMEFQLRCLKCYSEDVTLPRTRQAIEYRIVA